MKRNPKGGHATSGPSLRQPLKWHVDGGKAYLASRIIALAPRHTHYVEPYFGGGSVLLAKSPDGVSEVVNDLNGDLTNFWRVLQSPDTFAEFRRLVEATPFSEHEWDTADAQKNDVPHQLYPVAAAHNFFVRCRQSLAGRMTSFTGVTRTRTRRGMNNEVSAWLSAVEGLPAVHERLKRVLILSRPALDVIRGQDGAQTLFYVDCPYLHSTRVTTKEYGLNEMTEAQHMELLDALSEVKGKFLLSGYRSSLYDEFAAAHNWTRHDFEIANHASGGAKKRRMIESVWCRF